MVTGPSPVTVVAIGVVTLACPARAALRLLPRLRRRPHRGHRHKACTPQPHRPTPPPNPAAQPSTTATADTTPPATPTGPARPQARALSHAAADSTPPRARTPPRGILAIAPPQLIIPALISPALIIAPRPAPLAGAGWGFHGSRGGCPMKVACRLVIKQPAARRQVLDGPSHRAARLPRPRTPPAAGPGQDRLPARGREARATCPSDIHLPRTDSS